MATPTGLRQSSRDLGFSPQEQEPAQDGLPELPPGFTYTQLESMIRELRTAAALEVPTSSCRSYLKFAWLSVPAHLAVHTSVGLTIPLWS